MKDNIKRKLLAMILTVSMLLNSGLIAFANEEADGEEIANTSFTFLSTTAFAASTSIYKVTPQEGAPFRAKEEGSIVGNIPWATVLEVLDIKKGGYAKVKWNGYSVYVWADKLKAVDTPDAVCSKWAQDWITGMDGEYVGLKSQYPTAPIDYTKPITRTKMANMLMITMALIYSAEVTLDTYPVVLKGVDYPLTDTDDRYANVLATWGVLPAGTFRPNDIATYGEAVDAMIKLMDYDSRYICALDYGAPRTTVTREMIANLGIGGDTNPNALCTEEQLMVMYGKLACWAQDYNLRWYAAETKANDPGKSHEGLFSIVSDTYTIQTALGEKGKHPYLNINSTGQGELRNNAPQNFKVTYLKTNWSGRCYTIQTMDDKYLALDGMAVNGKRLITRTQPYHWYISNGQLAYISSTENSDQCLNTSGQKKDDATPIISWDLTSTYNTGNKNYRFIFEFAK